MFNGQKIQFAFVNDCCDRSILACSAGARMQVCDIELMVQRSLFKWFGQGPSSEGQLQFLHDNGPEYIEKGLRKQLEKWNIVDCNTPTYSPQSNGMCGALNCTFKYYYVYEHCLDNPQIVIDQIQGWVYDYNEFAPHSALKMKSPNEYFNLKFAA